MTWWRDIVVFTVLPSFRTRVILRGTHTYIVNIIIFLLFRHLTLAHRNKVEQTCSYCQQKFEDFTKLVEHHLKDHPNQIRTILQGKKKYKKKPPSTKRRTAHEAELDQRGQVEIKSAFKGDIIIRRSYEGYITKPILFLLYIIRLRNPAPQDTDISVLFGNLRRQIKEIFNKFYSQKAAFRWPDHTLSIKSI